MQSFELPEIPSRQLIFWTLAAAAVIGCFWLLWRFQDVLVLFLTAVILSTAVRPGVSWMEKRGIPKPVGILLIFALILIFLVVLIWFSLPALTQQTTNIMQNLNEGYFSLRESLAGFPNILVRRLIIILPDELPLIGGELSEISAAEPEVVQEVAETAEGNNQFITLALQFAAVVVLTFYWTLEEGRIKQGALLVMPIQKRDEIRQFLQDVEQKVSGYLLGQGLLVLIVGSLAFVAYLLIGLPSALLLAVIAGLLEAVPILGPFLGAIPAIIVGLSISPLTAIWVVVATIIIQQLENSLLVPRVMGKTIGVRPLVTLMALLAFGTLFGILGALIALPLAAVIQLSIDRFIVSPQEQKEPGRDRVSLLRYETNQLVEDVHKYIRQKENLSTAYTDEIEDELETIAADLEIYLSKQSKNN